MTQGIYKITNTINDNIYIGKSINIEQRFKEHINMLQNNKHHAYKLQEFYNKHKHKKLFSVNLEIVEVIENEKYLDAREQHYIKQYNSHQNGYNSIGYEGNSTHTKKKETLNRKLEKINSEKDIFNDLSSKYKDNLHLQYGGYNDTYLYRVNEAIRYFVRNYNLDLYISEISQYRSQVELSVIDKNFKVIKIYTYNTQHKCMILCRSSKCRCESDRNLTWSYDRYKKFDNIVKSQRRYKWIMRKFANLDEDILQYNTLIYTKTRYAIPAKTIRELIGYTGNNFKKHIAENSEIKQLSRELNISYPHGKVELRWGDSN